MRKPILFFDFDDLKIDTIPLTVAHINKHYNISSVAADYVNNPPLESILNKYLPKDKHVTNEEAYLCHAQNFHCSIDIHDNIPPLEGMCTVLPLLAQKYELWTVTARQKSSLASIEHVLNKHVPGCITGIHCVWEYKDGAYHQVPKRDFIAAFEGDKIAFFDDSVKEILAVQHIIPSYLYDPKRMHDDIAEIQLRVRSWQEIGELFL